VTVCECGSMSAGAISPIEGSNKQSMPAQAFIGRNCA
jgi:hypothetical protein